MMKRLNLILLQVLMCGAMLLSAQASWANWVLDHYEGTQTFEDFVYTKDSQNNVTRTHLHNENDWPAVTEKQPANFEAPPGAKSVWSAIRLEVQKGVEGNTSAESPQIAASLKITPVYKWVGDGEPTSSFFVRERSSCSAQESDYSDEYSSENPYTGQYLTVEVSDSLGGSLPAGTHYAQAYESWIRIKDGQWALNKVEAAPGEQTARGETREIKVTATANVSMANTSLYARWYAATLSVAYVAEVCAFSLDVSTNLVEDNSLHPRDRQMVAYASPNWQWAWEGAPPEEPTRRFWDGYAHYAANISPNLMEIIGGNPTYEWSGGGSIADHVALSGEYYDNPLDPFTVRHPEKVIAGSRPNKYLHHDLGPSGSSALSTQSWPTETTTSVKITGNNPEQSELTAKAKIEWYPNPISGYRAETVYEIIDLDTGEVMPLSSELSVSPEEADIDAYIAEVEASQDGFFQAYITIGETSTELGLMVIELMVPDPLDILTGGAGKIYDGVKAVRVLAKINAAVNKVGGLMHGAVYAKRVQNGKSTNFVIRSTERVFETGKYGKLPPNSQRANTPDPDIGKKKHRFWGEFCFVAGTPVLLSDGTLKPIEQIRVGDLVISKDESSGEVAAKRVAHTTKRQAPSTLLLNFSNGEHIETTAEHPFYVEHKGFTPAGLLAIGNSIVTRAGPGLEITSIEKKSTTATVYNFTVDEFHTYFVGNAGLWVHNISCGDLWDSSRNYGEQFRSLGKSQRPDVVTAIEIELKDGRKLLPYHGRNRSGLADSEWDGMVDDAVNDLYGGGGTCAEMVALTNFLRDGYTLSDIKSIKNFASEVGGPESAKHGKPWSACGSCQAALAAFNLKDIGGMLKSKGIRYRSDLDP